MSAQAEKVLRRDLRRAIGAEAIGVIDHNAKVIAELQVQVSKLREFNNFMTRAVDDRHHQFQLTATSVQEQLDRLYDATVDSHVAHANFTGRTFWQRLRWLVRGK